METITVGFINRNRTSNIFSSILVIPKTVRCIYATKLFSNDAAYCRLALNECGIWFACMIPDRNRGAGQLLSGRKGVLRNSFGLENGIYFPTAPPSTNCEILQAFEEQHACSVEGTIIATHAIKIRRRN